MYTVYVIESVEGYRYIGQTDNFDRRLFQHNSGISKWTEGERIGNVYAEEFETRLEAREQEKYLKTGVGRILRRKLKTEVEKPKEQRLECFKLRPVAQWLEQSVINWIGHWFKSSRPTKTSYQGYIMEKISRVLKVVL